MVPSVAVDKTSMDTESIKKIILLCLPGLGDSILFTPCLKGIREQFPNAKITVLTMFKASKEIFEGNPNIDEVLAFEFLSKSKLQAIKFLFRLRRRKFDLSITAFPAYRREYNIVSFVIGAKERVAHRFEKRYFTQFTLLNTKTVPVIREAHNVENNLNLLKHIGINVKNDKRKLDVVISRNDVILAELFLRTHSISKNDFLIGIHAGTHSRGFTRRWPKENFAFLAHRLIEEYGAKILLFCGPDEQDLAKEIPNLMTRKPVVVTDLSIKQVTVVIKKCSIFISVDSGLVHIAAAMHVPTVAIYGPSNPRLTYPWNTKHKVVRKELPCSPCYYYTDVRKANEPLITCNKRENFACVNSITAKDVMDAVKDVAKCLEVREESAHVKH